MERRARESLGAAVGVAVGLRAPHAVARDLQVHGLRDVDRAVGVGALQHGRDQHERLERRARLAVALRREVEGPVAVAARRGHRLDVAVVGVDRDDRRARVALQIEPALDRGAALLLQLRVDRRVDLQPALAVHADAVALDQLVLHVVEEVRLTARREAVCRVQLDRLGRRVGGIRLGDVAVVGHRLEDLVAALQRRALVLERVVLRGRLREAGDHRRLVEREVLGVLAEVGERGRLDADRRASLHGPVRHVVQVVLEDPALVVLLLELGGHLGLADLALEVALRVLDVERAHQLLRDRRAALHGLPRGEVLPAGADHALVVDAVVLVEALVLDGDRRLAQRDRHVVPRDRGADLGRLHVAEPGAVRGEDLGDRALVDRLQVVDVGCRGGDRRDVADHRRDADQDDRQEHAEREQDLLADAALVAALAFLSLAVGHPEGRRRRLPTLR